MIRVWGVLLGLVVAYAAALMVTATFAKATEQFVGNAAGSRPSDFERLHSTSIAATGEQDHD